MRKSFSLLILSAWIVLTGGSLWASGPPPVLVSPVLIPHITIEGREFVVNGNASAIALPVPSNLTANLWKFYILESAVQNCPMTVVEAGAKLAKLLAPDGTVGQSLFTLYPDLVQRLQNRSLTIVIDDFGAGTDEFASFMVPNVSAPGQSVIGLDCHETSVTFWESSLAHELTHVINEPLHLDSWADEMLAQMVEQVAGGTVPEARADRLASTSQLAYAFDVRRPLLDPMSYAMTYLMGRYLLDHWGGWDFLRAFAGITPNAGCVQDNFLEQATCRGQAWLRSQSNASLSQLQDKMTRAGLIRYFAVALTLNHPRYPIFNVQYWSGLQGPAAAQVAPGVELRPGEAMRLGSSLKWQNVNPGLEVYRLRSDEHDFQIVDRGYLDAAASVPDGAFYLVINTAKQILQLEAP